MGEAGVTKMLAIIRRELDVTLALTGLRSVRDVGSEILHR
jgi:L-lactate dehydrogenase (cytochrome)